MAKKENDKGKEKVEGKETVLMRIELKIEELIF